MAAVTKNFFRFGVQVWHFVGLPIFFFAISMVYHPFDIREFMDMGSGMLDFNMTIVTSIFFGVIFFSRLFFYLARKSLNLNLPLYAAWCTAEVFIASAFSALFVSLVSHGTVTFFLAWGQLFAYSFSILVFPYAILTLLMIIRGMREATAVDTEDLIRFRDSNGKLRLTIAPNAVLYVESKENYVNICYEEGTRIRTYLLRNSMKRTDELLTQHGMVRCHRTCIVNPAHVNILRRDREGLIFADLDVEGCPSIPVSKPNYDKLSSLL